MKETSKRTSLKGLAKRYWVKNKSTQESSKMAVKMDMAGLTGPK